MMHLIALCLLAGAVEPIDKQYDVEINGAKLHFHVRGKDPANPYAIFLHGGPGYSSLPFMATTGADLEGTLNMVYLDQRGCGASEHLTSDGIKKCSMEALVADIDGVRKNLGIKQWGVISHSFGGALGIKYAAEHPESVTFFVAISPVTSVPAMTGDILRNAEAKFNTWKKSASVTERDQAPKMLSMVKDFMKLKQNDPRRLAGAYSLALNEAQLYFADAKSPTMMGELKKLQAELEKYKFKPEVMNLASEPSLALVQNDNYLEMDLSSTLAKISVPTLLIGGKADGVITPEQMYKTKAGIKGAQIEMIENCGHFAFYEQPSRLLGTILRFVSTR
jgi:proline iminopeptidase